MKTQGWQTAMAIGLGMGGAIGFSMLHANAQSVIVPDGTLGGERSQVEFRNTSERITGGATRGINLFHSFLEFNVGAGRSTYFIAPNSSIENILARVTGSNPSQILGKLGTAQLVNGGLGASNANLFLINPNGIVFGQNASLDVDRSLVITTANAIQFPGGAEFSPTSSVDPQNPLLTVNPSAFLFNQATIQPIQNESQVAKVGLIVGSNSSLLLVGGDVTLNQGNIFTAGGHVELGGLAAPGIVGLNNSSNVLSLNFPEGITRANVFLTHQAKITVLDRGSITAYARNVELASGSSFLTSVGTSGGQAGDINIDATGAVRLSDSSTIVSGLSPGVSGSLGKINISGQSIDLINGSQVESLSGGQGNAGNITLKATEAISLYGRNQDGDTSAIRSQVGSPDGFTGTGNGGTVTLQARSLALKDGAGVLTDNLFAQGNAGNIQVDVSGSVSLTDSAQLRTSTSGTGGNAGNLILHAGSLSLNNGAVLNASTSGQGNAGNVRLTVSGTANFDGIAPDGRSSGVLSTVAQSATGQGGNVELSAGALSVTNGATLNASTYGQGDAGNVRLTVSGTASLDGTASNGNLSGVFSGVARSATGQGGNVALSAGALSITNGAVLSASTSGQGDAGNVRLTVSDAASLDGTTLDGRSSGIGSTVNKGATGQGGDVELSAGSLSITNGANLNASTSGQGDAGNVRLLVSGTASLDGTTPDGRFSSGIGSTVNKGATGQGGNVDLSAGALSITNGAVLNASTSGQGDAGNVRLVVSGTASLDGTTLDSRFGSGIGSAVNEGATGQGGNVNLSAGALFITNGAVLTASSSGQGSAGNIVLRVHDQLRLDTSTIVTASQFTSGGSIDIAAKAIRISGNSNIQTNVFNGVGNGGSITLTASSIIALNDSNILAFAQQGNGGNITFNTRAFFGQNYRPGSPAPFDGNNRVDINASGTISGIITLPDVSFI